MKEWNIRDTIWHKEQREEIERTSDKSKKGELQSKIGAPSPCVVLRGVLCCVATAMMRLISDIDSLTLTGYNTRGNKLFSFS